MHQNKYPTEKHFKLRGGGRADLIDRKQTFTLNFKQLILSVLSRQYQIFWKVSSNNSNCLRTVLSNSVVLKFMIKTTPISQILTFQ